MWNICLSVCIVVDPCFSHLYILFCSCISLMHLNYKYEKYISHSLPVSVSPAPHSTRISAYMSLMFYLKDPHILNLCHHLSFETIRFPHSQAHVLVKVSDLPCCCTCITLCTMTQLYKKRKKAVVQLTKCELTLDWWLESQAFREQPTNCNEAEIVSWLQCWMYLCGCFPWWCQTGP